LALNFCRLSLELLAVKQCFIPTSLQRGCDQSLRRVDFLIAPLGKRGFILGAFKPHLPLTSDSVIPCFQFLESCDSQLKVSRLQSLQYFLGDGGIEHVATEAHAAFAGPSVAVQPVALIAGIDPAVAGVANGERSATVAAHQESLE
jgi:hypothetical protein